MREKRDIFDEICNVNNSQYDVNFCWQLYELQYEASFRKSCSSYIDKNCENLDQIFSNSSFINTALLEEDFVKSFTTYLISAADNGLLQVRLADDNVSTTDALYLDVKNINDKCKYNGVYDSNCVEEEKRKALNETQVRLLQTKTFSNGDFSKLFC